VVNVSDYGHDGNGRARRSWRRVTGKHPCPICGKGDWCSVSADGGLVACRRVEAGCWKAKADKGGTPVYLHRLDGAARVALPPPTAANSGTRRAEPEQLHAVYTALLAGLSLSQRHREALHVRGLGDEEIDRLHYRSLPVQGRARLARELRDRFADLLLSVPGFGTKPGNDGKTYVTVFGAAGLLVPVRDAAARIVALLVRRDELNGEGAKYTYVSSARHGGPGPGAPVHVPLGVTGPAEVVRVTEGVLKSDVARALSGVPTIGLPGVSTWRPVLPLLRELGARTARLALDADAADKAAVARPLAALAEALAAEGFAVEMERWSAEHKGIDDALAAGAAVEVLTGDAAREAVADALTEATAGEPVPETGPLGRLAEVLADGGAEAVYRDDELLQALARLAEENPAEFACRRAQLHRAGIRLRDLDRTLAPLRQEIRREKPPLDAAGCYRVSAGRLVRDHLTKDGPVEVPLTNWSGHIVEQTVHDDGAERRLTFAVEGALADGTPLPRVEVAADRFPWMRWPVEVWGTRAVVLAGAATADHVRAALQLLSGDVPRRTVYGHAGWRQIGDAWLYLHGGGAIGPDGPATGIEVALPEPLAGFALPAPPSGERLVVAIRASLALLDGLVADRLSFPLLGATYRAALGEAPGHVDFSLYLAGPHGAGKSELAALAQQHFGAALDARHLPGSWASTANSLEALAFAAKDGLLVVDDYAPRGGSGDRQRLERDADRLLRAQGNRAGRGRMRADGTLRPPKPPRGLILSTGEDVPPGQSLRGRMLVLEVSPGDLPLARLTPHQRAAADGVYADGLAGFVAWLAPRYGELFLRLPGRRAELRDRALAGAASSRTPGIVADLALGLELFLDFALAAGALTAAERDALAKRGWQALQDAAGAHGKYVEAAEPTGHFLRLLAGALASGRAHLAGPDGGPPENPGAWGWRAQGGLDPRWEPQGRRIGWLDGPDDLLLEPEAAYAEAQELARHQGESLPVSSRTLWKRLRERNLLATWDERRQRNTVRRSLEGTKDRDVLHLRPGALSPCSEPSEPSAVAGDPPISPEKRTVLADGHADSNGVCGENRPQEPSAKPVESGGGGRFGRPDTAGETAQGAENTSPHGRRRRGIL
jgi:hypothetical protein